MPQKIYKYSKLYGVHAVIDKLQDELSVLTYSNETDPLNPTDVNWFDTIYGLAEEGKEGMPYGWSEEKSEHISTIADDKNKCQVFFTHENSVNGVGYKDYTIGIYIFMNEARVSNDARAVALNALMDTIVFYLFRNNTQSPKREILDTLDSQQINNNILNSNPLRDANFNPFKDKTIYGLIRCKIRWQLPCPEPFVVTKKFKCG